MTYGERIKAAVITFTALSAGAAILFGIDARYEHQAMAHDRAQTVKLQFAQASVDTERGRLETELKLAQLELKFVLAQSPSVDRDSKVNYLSARIVALEARLDDLRLKK
jgi:hypothetical protein